MSAQTSSKAWSGRPVLVTGAGGFIGSHLTEALARAGAEVRAFVRYNSRRPGWLEVADPDVAEIEVFRGDLNPEPFRQSAGARSSPT
jgi:dTDP-glucose 4,6-dehydratase